METATAAGPSPSLQDESSSDWFILDEPVIQMLLHVHGRIFTVFTVTGVTCCYWQGSGYSTLMVFSCSASLFQGGVETPGEGRFSGF